MEQQEAINLLTINDDADETNRLVNLLRNADLRVDPHYVATTEELGSKLGERNWDLALVRFDAESVPTKTVFQQIRRQGKDLPVVLVISPYDNARVVAGLKLGAADVVAVDDEPHLILVVRRMLKDLTQRRQSRYWQRRFVESETRFEHLIVSSRDAIAVIQEGMYVLVNRTFAQLYGHEDRDRLELMPVFDSLAKESQQVFRAYLKPLDPDNALESCVLDLEGQGADGGTFPIRAEVSQIDFRGEPALQLLVKEEFFTRGAAIADEDVAATASPGDIRVAETTVLIDAAIRRAARGGADALLWYMQIDNHAHLQKELGIGLVEEGIKQLAAYIIDVLGTEGKFGRIREDAFVYVASGQQDETGIAAANALLDRVAKAIFETPEGSFTCTLSVGITPVTELATSVDASLDVCQRAIAMLRMEKPEGNGVSLVTGNELGDDVTFDEGDVESMSRHMLETDGFQLLYQPAVPLHGHPEHFFSASAQVKADVRKGALPEDFLPTVRKGSVGLEFDRDMLRKAARALLVKKTSAPLTRLFFDLSDATLVDDSFPRWLKGLINELGLSPEDIVPQIRETSIGRQLGKVSAMAEALGQAGFRLALSHFGLAINPMATLNKIRVGFVRVDGMLVDKACREKADMKALIELVATLKNEGYQVIVPDVASAGVIPALWQAKVDLVEGPCVHGAGPEMDFDFDE